MEALLTMRKENGLKTMRRVEIKFSLPRGGKGKLMVIHLVAEEDDPIEVVLCATPEQQEVINCEGKIISVFGGRRYGKTEGICKNRGVKKCLEIPGFKLLYCSESYSEQVKPVYDSLANHSALQAFIRKASSLPFPHIIFHNDSQWDFRSLNRPQLLHGGSYDEIHHDEFMDSKEWIFDEVLQPLLIDRLGTYIAFGQFGGDEEHWTYKRFWQPGQEPGQDIYRSFLFPTSRGICFQTKTGKALLERLKKNTPLLAWQRLYECKPVGRKNQFFPPDDLERCRRGSLESGPVLGADYVVACDLGRVVDPSAIVVMRVDKGEPTVVHSELRPIREKHEFGAVYLRSLCDRYNDALAVVDVTGGGGGAMTKKSADPDQYVRHYRSKLKEMRGIIITNGSKRIMVDHLALMLQQGKIAIPAANDELHKQLNLYEYEYRHGVWFFHGPEGHKDDLTSALYMAEWAREKNWAGKREGFVLAYGD